MEDEMFERVARAIMDANAELEPGERGRRSVGYYVDVGIDHFKHPYEKLRPALASAAARAAIEAMEPFYEERMAQMRDADRREGAER